MSKAGSRRVLLLHAGNVAAPGWRALRARLPQAECVEDRASAAQRLETAAYDLIVSEAMLPGGGPFGLLRDLIARQQHITVVVHFCAEDTERWLKLFEEGAFDLEANPMASESFFRWLEDWQSLPQAASARSAVA